MSRFSAGCTRRCHARLFDPVATAPGSDLIVSMASPRNSFNDTTRIAATIGLAVLLLLLAWYTVADGYASRVSINGAKNNDLVALAQATRLSPADAENQYLRAAVLEANGEIASAISVYTEAVSLRPGDYVLWLSLARARELNGEMPGAIAAARQAVPLAPFYAQTHWQLGNLLVRAGQWLCANA